MTWLKARDICRRGWSSVMVSSLLTSWTTCISQEQPPCYIWIYSRGIYWCAMELWSWSTLTMPPFRMRQTRPQTGMEPSAAPHRNSTKKTENWMNGQTYMPLVWSSTICIPVYFRRCPMNRFHRWRRSLPPSSGPAWSKKRKGAFPRHAITSYYRACGKQIGGRNDSYSRRPVSLS